MANSGAAPTGCYKCGRPGHWSRDCPSSASNPNPNSGSSFKVTAGDGVGSSGGGGEGSGAFKPALKSEEKPKKEPKRRPKLTPELLLSDDGLGYILRHFPRAFKYRGRGHEVSDLGNLIRLYSEWHSHLFPSLPFNQFVHKVEQVASTKRLKVCFRDLREKVARGDDPTKFNEPFDGNNGLDLETEAMNLEEPSHSPIGPTSEKHDDEDIPNEMLHEIYMNANEEPSTQALHTKAAPADILSKDDTKTDTQDQEPVNATSSTKILITDEQKARIEANRLKALEKAKSRVRSLPVA